MQQQEIHTISKMAPPSYAEAMGFSTGPKNDQHVPTTGQSHGQQSQGPPASMPASMPMPMPMPMPTSMPTPMPMPMPMPAPSYQNENSFYRGTSGQPQYNPSFPSQGPYPTQPGSLGTEQHHYIVHADTVVVPQRRFRDRCCNKKVTITLICIILVIYVLKQRLHPEKQFLDEITNAQY